MLAYFRSQHAGQSWVTALGVVLDAATLTAACVHGAEDQEPYLMYRRGRRAVEEISLRLQGAAYGQELAASRAVRDRVRVACNTWTCRCAMSTTPGTACNASVPCMAYNSRA